MDDPLAGGKGLLQTSPGLTFLMMSDSGVRLWGSEDLWTAWPQALESQGGGLGRTPLSHSLPRQDFQFTLKGIARLLSNPLLQTYLPNSTKKIQFHQELLVLFWKLCDFNKVGWLRGPTCRQWSAPRWRRTALDGPGRGPVSGNSQKGRGRQLCPAL